MGSEGIYNRVVCNVLYEQNANGTLYFLCKYRWKKKIYLTLAYNEAGLQPYSCALA